ncbi:MAG: hypothetical protein JSW61_07105 [Candidatus Thorarchaeota archaeon]|nr:MAG: hypothetical protein JSW61_07105 [Candidatus Thorarchaeota archaeon]
MDWKLIAQRLAALVSSFIVYLPIVAGILTPMIWVLAAWYVSWYVFLWIFPFSEIWGGFWWPFQSPVFGLMLWLVEALILAIGLMLFLFALKEIVEARRRGMGIVTSGLYKYVRHPQHLGIMLMLLPLALTNVFQPAQWWGGIRPGDLLSWSFVAFLLIIIADLEETRLLALFGQDYEDYAQRTPFILPKVNLLSFIQSSSLSRGKPLRYILAFVIFWILASLMLFGFTLVELAYPFGSNL